MMMSTNLLLRLLHFDLSNYYKMLNGKKFQIGTEADEFGLHEINSGVT